MFQVYLKSFSKCIWNILLMLFSYSKRTFLRFCKMSLCNYMGTQQPNSSKKQTSPQEPYLDKGHWGSATENRSTPSDDNIPMKILISSFLEEWHPRWWWILRKLRSVDTRISTLNGKNHKIYEILPSCWSSSQFWLNKILVMIGLWQKL